MRKESRNTGSRPYPVTRVPEAEIKLFPRGLSNQLRLPALFPSTPQELQGLHIDNQANTDVREYGEADQVSTCQPGSDVLDTFHHYGWYSCPGPALFITLMYSLALPRAMTVASWTPTLTTPSDGVEQTDGCEQKDRSGRLGGKEMEGSSLFSTFHVLECFTKGKTGWT
ncbi:hypothetical protein KUCAC02_016069 [Chaenocephalus aceratus]|uniref:Uncharacterized protein n=1 Tax=Chaenocephalus aceratus TaxID=36190 RepID=A0ACB9Y1Q7_CHAAC|nr:hypothetical protein KUCAC02_016069 [Chaenocephalus aceratus]